jgi:hypothetical protein
VESIGIAEVSDRARVHVPLVSPQGSNAAGLWSTEGALRHLLAAYPEVGASLAASGGKEADEFVARDRRGRKLGSTNWSRERFWRRYRQATQYFRRPYRRTHLAAHIGLSYQTFTHYLDLWGPPEGVAAPGE